MNQIKAINAKEQEKNRQLMPRGIFRRATTYIQL